MFPYSKLFNGEDGVSHFKRMRFSEDSEVAQRWRVSNTWLGGKVTLVEAQ